MDTSETYIKMCEKAEEIQGLRGDGLWQNGDCYTCIVSGGRRFTAWWTDTEDEPPQMFHPVWLPRQDQLQEMVIKNTINADKLGSLLSRFWVFCSCFYRGCLTFEVFTSMEQLWLAFVMREKYNKAWNGKSWIVQ